MCGTTKQRKGPQRTPERPQRKDFTEPLLLIIISCLATRKGKNEYIKDLRDIAENVHDVTIQWFAPPTALLVLE